MYNFETVEDSWESAFIVTENQKPDGNTVA